MTIELLTRVLGWILALHIGLLALTSIGLLAGREKIQGIHSRLLGVPESELPKLYMQYLMIYKLLILVTALVPWLALQLAA